MKNAGRAVPAFNRRGLAAVSEIESVEKKSSKEERKLKLKLRNSEKRMKSWTDVRN